MADFLGEFLRAFYSDNNDNCGNKSNSNYNKTDNKDNNNDNNNDMLTKILTCTHNRVKSGRIT